MKNPRLLRNISPSCLTDAPALLQHTDCTVNESVADLFQLMELLGHKLLFWPCQAVVVLLVSQRHFITPQPGHRTVNLLALSSHSTLTFLMHFFFFVFFWLKTVFLFFSLFFFLNVSPYSTFLLNTRGQLKQTRRRFQQ